MNPNTEQGLGMSRICVLLLAVAALILSVRSEIRRENVKFLRCPVCEEISKQLYTKISDKQTELSLKKKRVSELQIIELVENLCNIKKQESEWMFFLDIVRERNKLKLVQQPEEGECNTKCKTIERTCQEVIGDHDTDLAEYIYKNLDNLSVEAIAKTLCKELTSSCSSKPPSLPKHLDLGEPFTPKPGKDADISKLMRSLGDMPGAPGMKMYSKDDLMNMNPNAEDDEDEDEDEEDKFESLIKKQKMKPEAPKAVTPKDQILAYVKDLSREVGYATEALVNNVKRRANTATKYVRRWLRKRSKGQSQKKTEL